MNDSKHQHAYPDLYSIHNALYLMYGKKKKIDWFAEFCLFQIFLENT